MTETNKCEIERILQKLDEKLINKEIDETIYNELKAKYENQIKEIEKKETEEKIIAEAEPAKIPSEYKAKEPKKVDKIHKMVHCVACGAEISNKAEICPSCGIRVQKSGTGKKIAIAALVLIAFVVIASIVWIQGETEQREAMKNVQVSLSDVQLRNIGLTSATVDIVLNMYNPNSRTTATLDRLDYMVYANGIYLGNGYISQRVDIPPLFTKTVSTTFQVQYTGALGAVWSVLTQGGRVNWNLKGTAYFDTPLGTINIPIDIY